MLYAAVQATSLLWLLLEITLVVRDHRQGKGSSSRDRGTRWLIVAFTLLATVTATALQAVIPADSPLQIGLVDHAAGGPAIGLALMWLGLAVRIWSITQLGSGFRTTVEVETGQAIVTRGPYRWVRHPSYAGALLLALGYGVAAGNWPAVAVTAVLPLGSILRRIAVEERLLVRVMGRRYLVYRGHTKRLIPGVW